jgi:hypothetical protein
LKFEFAAEDIHQELDDEIHGAQCVGEEHESDDDGVLFVESK